MKSWKTTLCGLLGVALASAAQAPGLEPQIMHWLSIASNFAFGLGLMFSRDANVSSEQQGLKP